MLAQLAADVDATQLGQHHVQQHEIGLHLVEAAQRFGAVGGHLHVEPFLGQADGEDFHIALLVLNDQHHLATGGHHTTPFTGRRRVKVEPSPSTLLTVTAPPWLAAT